MVTPARRITADHNARLAARDPRVGPLVDLEPTDLIRIGDAVGARSEVSRAEGDPIALWGPRRQSVLRIRCATVPDESILGPLLDRWLVAAPLSGDDAAHVCRLPVADREAARPLLRRGFVPTTTTVVARADASATDAETEVGPVRVARAEDREAVLDLLQEMHESDVAWGGSVARPDARRLLATYADEALADPSAGSSWVVDGGEGPVGFLALSSIEGSQWAAGATTLSPAAYLGLAAVAEHSRAGGIGTALEAVARRRARAWGAEAIVLDHAALSPLSATFWHRRGYRPLLTTWMRAATA